MAATDGVGLAWRPMPAAQWTLVSITLVWAAVLAIALPAWAMATAPPEASQDDTGRVSVGNVSLQPAPGWVLDPAATVSIKLGKAGASLLAFPASPSTQSATEAVQLAVDGFRADTTVAYQIGDVVELTTDSGLDGAYAIVLDPESATIVFAVSDGSQLAQGLVTSKAASWDSVKDEAIQMLGTLAFEDGGA